MKLTVTSKLFFSAIVFLSLAKNTYSQSDVSANTSLLITKANDVYKKAMYDSAIFLCNRAVILSQKNGNKKDEARSYNLLADIKRTRGEIAAAKKYDSLLLPIATQLKDTALIIDARNRNGLNLLDQGKTGEAADMFISILKMKLEHEQSLKTAEAYSNLASVYMALSKNELAMEYFFKSLRLYERYDDERGQGETYSNISSIYYLMGRVNDAIDFQKKSIYYRERQNDIQGLIIPNINIGQLYILKDSSALAFKHLSTAVVYADKINNPRLRASAYSGMSTYYIRTKNFDSAIVWQNKSIALFEETNNKTQLSRMYVSAGNLANAIKDSTAAIHYYQKALQLSIQLFNRENIANAYDKLSNFYIAHNDFQNAYKYYKSYVAYKDSISLASELANIEKVKIQYETEKKDKEILQLASDQRINQLQIEKQNALLLGNKAEAAQKEKEIQLLSQARQLQELKIQQQDEQLDKQMLLAKNNEQQLQLAAKEKELQEKQLQNQKQVRNGIIGAGILLLLFAGILFNRYQLKKRIEQQNALLEVRNSIAKDLHDEIGSTLTSIKILSEVSKTNLQKDQQKAGSMIEKITEQSSQMQQGMSDIVWAIKPDNDKLENMVVRMREYINHTLEPKNIKTIFTVDEAALSKSIGMQQRKDFFLIFKEAVNNAAKYSGATVVNIHLQTENGNVKMRIKDDGAGFDPLRITSSSGLKNMKARTEALHGKFNLRSAPGQGTEINVEVPAT